MNEQSFAVWPWVWAGLVFLGAVWIVLAPTWVGYPLTSSDWITAAVLAGSALGLGFWSLALGARPYRDYEAPTLDE